MNSQDTRTQAWKVVEDGSYPQVRDLDGRFVAGVGDTNWREGGECVEAQAHLIAAAPAMLAALEGLFRECVMIHRFGGEGDNTKAANAAEAAARAAIAAALSAVGKE